MSHAKAAQKIQKYPHYEELGKYVKLSDIEDIPHHIAMDLLIFHDYVDAKIDEDADSISEGMVEAFKKLDELGLSDYYGKELPVAFGEYLPEEASMTTIDVNAKQAKAMKLPGPYVAMLVNTGPVAMRSFKEAIAKRSGGNYACQIGFRMKDAGASDHDILKEYYKNSTFHEFAHVIDARSGGKLMHSLLKPVQKALGYKNIDEMRAAGDEPFKWIAKNISKYATADPYETFAEGFARWMDDPEGMEPHLKDFYDNLFTKMHDDRIYLKEENELEPFLHHYPDPAKIDKDGNVIINREAWDEVLGGKLEEEQLRLPKGTPTKGTIHGGEFTKRVAVARPYRPGEVVSYQQKKWYVKHYDPETNHAILDLARPYSGYVVSGANVYVDASKIERGGPKARLIRSLVKVGGDEWNQHIAKYLEEGYQLARPKLEDIYTNVLRKLRQVCYQYIANQLDRS